jgi:MATE family multidrug resistance protein
LILTIRLSFYSVTFIFIPLSLSIAVTTRISRLLVSQNPVAAQSSALVSIAGTIVLVSISSYILYETRFILGYLFTYDTDIISRVRQLAPLVALFQIINGLQGISQGIMRGMNRHTELVGYTFLSYWIIAMPFGLYLTFYTRPRTGLKGLWYGFITGLSMLSIVLATIILTTDWEREVRRARIRVEKYQNHYETFQTSPMTGGRALGGFLLLSSTGEEELDDVERIEIQLVEDEEKTK